MREDVLRKDTLKVGDKVGIRIPTRIGWQYFRYPQTVIKTIARITPARTKFVMEDGTEYGKNEDFYKITEKSQHETKVAQCACKIQRCLNAMDTKQREGKFFSRDDEKIIRLSEMLEKAVKETD